MGTIRPRNQAWLTYVSNDDDVASALVLVESLRRTKTFKRIGVIIFGEVSKDLRMAVKSVFDDFFIMDDTMLPSSYGIGLDKLKLNAIKAKLFAMSLELYDRCVFLEPNTLVAGNIDELFQIRESTREIKNPFIFKPSKILCEYLFNKLMSCDDSIATEEHIFVTGVNEWNDNNQSLMAQAAHELNSKFGVAIFSVENGELVLPSGTIFGYPCLVQLVDVPNTTDGLVNKLNILRNMESFGLIEKMITNNWLQIYEECVREVILNPKSAISSIINTKQTIYENEPIAIVGMSCRFPGANNLEEFWDLLYEGRDGMRQPPAFRWRREDVVFGGMGKESKTNAGFLSDPVDQFDAKFFGISRKEAETLDPQGRLLHEVLWESLENSGIDPLSLRGSLTGVFTGSWMYDYKDIVQASTERDFFRTYLGNSIGATAARLSFLLGLTGPNIATESGCSSAIVAVHMAVNSLWNSQSNLALAGGVNLLLHPFKTDIIEHVIAPDGRCKTFDEKANGFGRAEGCGVLVMKRLSDAIRDGDNIWALIRGSAISQEGLSRSIGTPTVHCEALSMELALKDAGVRPEQVTFVETHGTGTSVGDPMEVAAAAKAYHTRARMEPLIIGSVKTNVGHTESCAGITGMIKTILAMKHEIIPKHLNLDTINPEVNLEAIPAIIPLEPLAWPKVEGHPRFAGVSSFGFTGTDGHVILEEAPEYKLPQFHSEMERPMHLMKCSAKTKEAMDDLLQSYSKYFQMNPETNLANTAFTANTGRANFDHRAFIIAGNYGEAASCLQGVKLQTAVLSNPNPGKICFLFTGQGSQYFGMAKTLYETNPVFRIHFDICESALHKTYNISIKQILWHGQNVKDLSQTIYSQTSIFCIQYCLLKLWESWGIRPDFVLGHSLGEFCAAVAAGILNFDDALMLVAERSRLIDRLPRGSMLVIRASVPEVEYLMTKTNIQLDYAAVNSPEQTVVAGDSNIIQQFLEVCKKDGMKAIILEASHAFHSRHMEQMLEIYRKIAEKVNYRTSEMSCRYISGMEGRELVDPSKEINADYWVRHTREKVSFLDACQNLNKLDCQHFLEIGPQPVLSSFVMQNIEDVSVSCYPSLRRNTQDWETIFTSLGKLYLRGFKVDWNQFDRPYSRKKIPSLPFYPFHRKPFWVDCSNTDMDPMHPLIGSSIKNASTIGIFENSFTVKKVPYVKDHCLEHRILMPGAVFTEMCLASGFCFANSLHHILEQPRRPMALENMTILAPLELEEDKAYQMQVIVDLHENVYMESESASVEKNSNNFRVRVFRQVTTESENTVEWVHHASAVFQPVVNTNEILCQLKPERVRELMETKETLSTEAIYKRIQDAGMIFGETFRQIEKYWTHQTNDKNEELVAEMKVPKDIENYVLHPIMIDAFLQSVIFTTLRQIKSDALTLPVRIGKLIWLGAVTPGSDKLYIHAWWEDEICSMFLLNKDLTPVAFTTEVELFQTNVRTVVSMLEQQTRILPDSWEEIWRPIPGPYDNSVQLLELEPIISSEDLSARLKKIDRNISKQDAAALRKLNRLVYLYSLNGLCNLGWTPNCGEIINVEILCEKYKIAKQFYKLVHFYLRMFEEEQDIVHIIGHQKNGENCWTIKRLAPKFEKKIKKEMQMLYNDISDDVKLGPVINIVSNIGNQLSEILSGKRSALSILYPTELNSSGQNIVSAEMGYQNYPGCIECKSKISEIAGDIWRQLWHSNQDSNSKGKKVVRILEVGSGTGSMSSQTLSLLTEIWGNQFEYYFTDISPSFFAKAEHKFSEYRNQLKFCTFNIEEPALDQGIPMNYFDMILASDVLHATKNLKQSLQNLRQTLKPEGTILFTESLIQDRAITFVFGLLEGYWRFEDFDCRPNHTCVGGDKWKELLLETGFKYAEISEVYMSTMGVITAQASDIEGYKTNIARDMQFSSGSNRWIIFSPGNDLLMPNLVDSLNGSGTSVTEILPIEDADDETIRSMVNSTLINSDIQVIIYAWGMRENVTDQNQISLPLMHIAKYITDMKQIPPRLFVFTRRVHEITEHNEDLHPSAATLLGMTKVLKNENSDLFVRYIDFDSNPSLNEILFELAMTIGAKEKERLQVAYRSGVRFEPRLSMSLLSQNYLKSRLQLPSSSNRYKLILPTTKLISDLTFDVLDVEPLQDVEVEVAVKAYSLNFRDLFSILKPSDDFEKLIGVGLDFAGVVTKVGDGVTPEKFKIGDRVFGMNSKAAQLPSHVTINAEILIHIPKRMTFAEAATLPAIFSTGIYCLMYVAKLQQGETVLIHTGSGGVGLAAIQVAMYIGANIITTAGTPKKRAYLKALGIEHVFHSRNTSFEQDIMRVTNGKGVDVVLNSMTGPGFKEATLACCTKNARFVEMSKLGVWTEEEVSERRPDVEYTRVDLSAVEMDLWKELLKKVEMHLLEGNVKLIPYVQYDTHNIRQALQHLQRGKHIGKIVVTMPEVKPIEGQWKILRPLFNEESTYIITGGLGGIGFEVCKWMLEMGATDIVLIGRNEPKPEILKHIEYFNNRMGYNVKIKLGDVGKYDQCKRIFDKILEKPNDKPIRGIHHCAGVLRDNFYGNQTWTSFSETFNPKVDGTWNLHNLSKPMSLEHFVLYSSISALGGTPGQSNHAAANCFEDAFAHYRHSLGLPATAINWGQWSQVGCATEINIPGVRAVSVKRMLNALEVALRIPTVQMCFGDFDSFNVWMTSAPIIKHYLDEGILKNLKDGFDQNNHVLPKPDKFWQEMDEAVLKIEKMAIVTRYVKVILRTALRMEENEPINEDANMKELGVDSLMLIELKNTIQSLLGSRLTVTANMLKDCNTIRDLSNVIVSKIYDRENSGARQQCLPPEELEKLLKTDCNLDKCIQAPTTPEKKLKSVLITGVTGQLGPYVLSTLCKPEYEHIEKIFCVVRTNQGISPRGKLEEILEQRLLSSKVDMSRVECIKGDVTLENFGIEQAKYNHLCELVDGIIHLAAKSDYVEPYIKHGTGSEDIRSVNVIGTLNVLKFASTMKTKWVYFASSIFGVFGGNAQGNLCDDWPENSQIKVVAENCIY